MLPIKLELQARRDFDESFDWYAKRSQAAAEQFVIAVDQALARIAKQPNLYGRIDAQHQACRLFKFPFSLVFAVRSDCILIVAIAHDRRQPGYWRTTS